MHLRQCVYIGQHTRAALAAMIRIALEGNASESSDLKDGVQARVVLEEVSRRLPTLRLADSTPLAFPANIRCAGRERCKSHGDVFSPPGGLPFRPPEVDRCLPPI